MKFKTIGGHHAEYKQLSVTATPAHQRGECTQSMCFHAGLIPVGVEEGLPHL
jgi:hypothetical protein